ncbi:MAG TPA: pilus assembly protein N-terminal domain-containing protein [Pseudomonadales bacterium]
MQVPGRLSTVLKFLSISFLVFNIHHAFVYAEENDENIEVISIVSGRTQTVNFENILRVSIGHPDIVNVKKINENELLFTGLKPGVTDLRLWSKDNKEKQYLLRVTNPWLQTLETAQNIVADIEGVSAREDNGVIYIEGRLFRERDTTIINDMKKKLRNEINKGYVVFRVDEPSVNLKAMIMLDVKVVEVRRNNLKDIGIEWSRVFNGPFYEVLGEFEGSGSFNKLSSFFGFGLEEGTTEPFTEIGSTIRLLQEKGLARMLAQPKLVTRSGSAAEFVSGGEVPIPLVDSRSGNIDVEFKKYGVLLNIEPFSDPDGFIAASVEVEVSDIDRAVSVLGIPGFITRRTKSEVNMRSGQTLVISGMLNNTNNKSTGKVPGLGSIPIIGELFKTRLFSQAKTELVVFVTPSLIDIDSVQNLELIEHANKITKDSEKELKFSIFD